jgi:hypothetical protein
MTAGPRSRFRLGFGRPFRRRFGGPASPFAVAVLVALVTLPPPVVTGRPAGAEDFVFEGPVPRAECGPGSRPETGLQGQVPLEDRASGRSASGYRCNVELVGQYQGEGASLMGAWYDHCYYYSTALGGTVKSPGVQVIDASNPKQPKLTTALATLPMSEPWESLKVHEGRDLLAAVQMGPAWNPPTVFHVWDVKSDCTAPRLLSTLPLPVQGHEGAWAPDGNTYWIGHWTGGWAAIDVSDPRHPRLLYADDSRVHGLSLSADGNTAYLAVPSIMEGDPNGLRVVDVSEVQSRRPLPRVHTLSTLYWTDGSVAQRPIPVTYGGRPFVIFTDEAGSRSGDRSAGWLGFGSPAGATRIIDISDVPRPRIVSKLKLEIQMPEQAERNWADTEGNGGIGYQTHYCDVDQDVDPTALACSHFESGIRVFDIRNPYQPREIAYFNPPAQIGKQAELQASWHASGPEAVFASIALKAMRGEAGLPKEDSFPRANLTADWCTSQVRFYKPRNELWTHCTDNGFMTLKFTNGAYPLVPVGTPRPPYGNAELAGADGGTGGQKPSAVVSSSATETARSPTTPREWPAVAPGRSQPAYGCMIVPPLDERRIRS